jgi:magnesium transporter
MNFKNMPELEQPLGYPLVMAFMLGLCSYLYYRFRRAGWI